MNREQRPHDHRVKRTTGTGRMLLARLSCSVLHGLNEERTTCEGGCTTLQHAH